MHDHIARHRCSCIGCHKKNYDCPVTHHFPSRFPAQNQPRDHSAHNNSNYHRYNPPHGQSCRHGFPRSCGLPIYNHCIPLLSFHLYSMQRRSIPLSDWICRSFCGTLLDRGDPIAYHHTVYPCRIGRRLCYRNPGLWWRFGSRPTPDLPLQGR